jgi:hypothetical protein
VETAPQDDGAESAGAPAPAGRRGPAPTGGDVIRYAAAAGFAAWTLYNLVTLLTTGEFWVPGGRYISGAWRPAAADPLRTALAFGFYLALVAIFLFVRPKRGR